MTTQTDSNTQNREQNQSQIELDASNCMIVKRTGHLYPVPSEIEPLGLHTYTSINNPDIAQAANQAGYRIGEEFTYYVVIPKKQ